MTSAMESAFEALPVDKLKSAGQDLIKALVDRAVSAALEQVDGLTDRLGDVAENGGEGLSGILGGGGGGSALGGALSSGASAIKDKVSGALGSVVPGMGATTTRVARAAGAAVEATRAPAASSSS